MNHSLKIIGVDLGGESGRVMLGRFDGSRIELEQKHRFETGGIQVNGTLRWDVNRFWTGIENGLSVIASENHEVVSIGVDTWGVDYVLLGENKELLGLPFHYRDQRNVGMLEKINQTLTKDEIYSRTGIQFMEINTICQLFAARNSNELNEAKHFLTIPDYFHWRLSGVMGNEFTNATTTQCFDSSGRTWAKSMLESLAIPTAMFEGIVEPGTKLGSLSNDIADRTGLRNVSVVVPATHDTSSAVVAVPVDTQKHGRNWAYISSGTWSLVGVELDEPVLSDQALAANVTNEGGVNRTWRTLKNVMGLWIVQRCKHAFAQRGFLRDYSELAQLASAATGGVLIDPDHPIFLNPENMELAVHEFLNRSGQRAVNCEGELIRCVLESLALRYSSVLAELEALTGLKIEVVHVVGGGSRNNVLNQFIANATGLKVVAGPAEATVLGNVLVQCQNAGALSSLGEIREVVKNSTDLAAFEPVDTKQWQEKQHLLESVAAKARNQ